MGIFIRLFTHFNLYLATTRPLIIIIIKTDVIFSEIDFFFRKSRCGYIYMLIW